ncbi:OB-fold domain-containing protein [Novosphingobium sp. ES2-1]|uniref:OB-fold domain-containing protein n=1 Tax=Novosphingobium sp. ES2-1 TaxID=2780074 RepID=UPI001882F73F|nr:OB-fold domain-containing protein [Novosphingobium sp. ES2-1]QOV96419.1 OB-fold domain-containing protein [Novosphingobium sp. ES2-1]
MSAGITAWGAYIPRHRIAPAVLAGRKPAEGAPERSVAWADEDSITMAVEAARRCLAGKGRDGIGLVAFASTTHPFEEKQAAALVSAVLGLPAAVRSVDIAHSLRAGAQALALASDAVRSGSVDQALVIVADCRQGAPGSELERSGGDAAVAFLLGRDGVVAELIATSQQTNEIIETWRRAGDRFTHGWEDRFATQYGQLSPIIAAAKALPEAQSDRVWAFSASNSRSLGTVTKSLRASPVQASSQILAKVGFCGAAHAPLLLAAALDSAEAPGEIALSVHGDGAEAQVWRVIAPRPATSVADTLADREPIASAAIWRAARKLDITEYPAADDQGIAATIHFRERAENNRLQGQRCTCGEPQFPKGRVCIRCGGKDQFTAEDFAETGGHLVTYTLDAFFPSPTPPTAVGIVQVAGGPRIYMQVTDLSGATPQLGMPLRFVFRRIHTVGLRPNYFWKAVPAVAREGAQA